ncbi:hypothetical protein GYMLUDRAFT_65907 [Collybiopsis luxurians FD-317 M1]|nr:hypothetical protein GYMLUDRAFT_65907 [Collybiopsis luxurians FD-317 M1]
MSAKVHTHGSNRGIPSQVEKKVVFKGVLDNPYRIHWPSVPVNLQNLVLAHISSLLSGVLEYQKSKSLLNRKRKREEHEKIGSRKKKQADASDSTPVQSFAAASEMQVDTVVPNRPEILAHVVTGINTVTKRLETLVRSRRGGATDDSLPGLKLVLVCRADVNPPMLIDHLPHLVAAYNSTKPPDPILLVPLPKGAELILADIFGLRRVAVIGIDKNAPDLSIILSLLASVPTLTAAWLSTEVAIAELRRSTPIIPTHIKQLRTTAPKDMKAAKERRAAGRAAAKEKKKEEAKATVAKTG